jgi:hypothetical protein
MLGFTLFSPMDRVYGREIAKLGNIHLTFRTTQALHFEFYLSDWPESHCCSKPLLSVLFNKSEAS